MIGVADILNVCGIFSRFFCGTIWSSGRSLDSRIGGSPVRILGNILFTFDIFEMMNICEIFPRFFCGTIWSSGRSLDFRIEENMVESKRDLR